MAGAGHGAAGVVHEHVEPPEVLDRGVDEVLERASVFITSVGTASARRPSRLISAATSSRSAAVARRAHDVGARFGEADGDAAADALAGAGDDRDLARRGGSGRGSCAGPREGAARPATERQVEVGLDARVRRRTRRARRSRSAWRWRRCRGCGRGRCAMESGWSPWNVAVTGGSPLTSTSKRSRSGPNVHAGSRCSSPMSQLTARGDDRLAVDETLPPEPLRGDQARLDHADRRVDRRGRDRHLVGGAQLGVEVEAELVGHHVHRLAEAGAEDVGHDARARLVGLGAEQHQVADRRRVRRRCGCRRTPRRARA